MTSHTTPPATTAAPAPLATASRGAVPAHPADIAPSPPRRPPAPLASLLRHPISVRARRVAALGLVILACASAPAQCQEGNEWDLARARLLATAPDSISSAVARWQGLTASGGAQFDDLAGFLLAWPGFPEETRLRNLAERASLQNNIDAGRLVAFFDKFPPLTNPARAHYALALAAFGRPDATTVAHAAWRGGAMTDSDEAAIRARWGSTFTTADNDARLDSLLWDGNQTQAQRGFAYASAAAKAVASARMALARDVDPEGPPPAAAYPSPPAYGTPQQGYPAPGSNARPYASPYDTRPAYPPRGGGMVQALPPGYRPGGEQQGPVVQQLPPGYRPGGEDQGTGTQGATDSAFGGTYPQSTYPQSTYPQPAYPQPAYAPAFQPPAAYAPVATLRADPGYLLERARYLVHHGRLSEAAEMLANHPALAHPTRDAQRWFAILLAAARATSTADLQARLAEAAQSGLAAGTDISDLDFKVRDDATSLFWAGGTAALWQQGDGARAARLFAAYAEAARTPQTRAKGYYWAGRALQTRPPAYTRSAATASSADPASWYAAAARYPDQYYGLLALERLGRPVPPLQDPARPPLSESARAAYDQRGIVRAAGYVSRDSDWQTTVRFFRALGASATTPEQARLNADYARQIGRRDLGVITAQAAANAGLGDYRDVGFPLVPVPAGTDWTWVHAISRQESQFSQNAVSGAGARGLMQLMTGTASDQARKMGLSSSASALTEDPALNMRLGDGYFQHLLSVFNNSYPLAVAAYNAGPGSVGRWLAQNGDPRTGAVDWIDWIEKIPVTETRGYVEHVLENAVVYEALYPAHAAYRGPNPLSHYLGKRTPG